MLRRRNVCAVRLLNLCLAVSLSAVFGVSRALPGLPGSACTFNLTLRNFRPILSWTLESQPVVPARYTLWYTYMSKPTDLKVVEGCANVTRSFCDVTHEWVNLSEMYIPNLVGSRGNTVLVVCEGTIFPGMQMTLEPPDFEIVSFRDRIHVVLKLPPAMPKVPHGGGLWRHLTLVIREESEGFAKQHKLKINETTTGNFIYVLDKLIPNTNYCVSVYFEPKTLAAVKRSPLKCAHLLPEQDSEPSEPARIGGLVTLFLFAAAVVITAALKRIGYICLRNKLPQVLNFHNLSTWVFPELPPLDPVAVLEVIHVHRKKKVWDYSYDDDSDSEDDAALRGSAGGYTMHGLTARLLCPVSTSPAPLEDCGDRDAQEAGLSEPEAGSWCPMAPKSRPYQGQECAPWPYEGRGTQQEEPPSVEDHGSESFRDRLFNVDLNSVCVRVLDEDEDEDKACEDSEDAPLFPPDDTVGPKDPNKPETSLWHQDSPSDQSDTSESHGGMQGGYLRR